MMTLTAIIIACGTLAAPPGLTMRSGCTAPDGGIDAVDSGGVRIRTPGGEDQWIGWDRIAAVDGEFADQARAFRVVADTAWRARTRMERGDLHAAEPLFEELFAEYRGRTGPTAAMVAGGLLRCRVSRGAQAAAVPPWLALWRSWPEGDLSQFGLGVVEGDRAATMIVDPETRLVPALPPVWLELPSVQPLARGDGLALEGGGDAAALASLYAAAAAFEVGAEAQLPAKPAGPSAVVLVWEIVAARIGSPEEREAARGLLSSRIRRQPPPWIEAWCRAAIGRSLARETDREHRLLAISNLLELPSRLPDASPYLTGVALAEAAVISAELGDDAGAALLKRELTDRYAGHSALGWEPLRAIDMTSAHPGAKRAMEPRPSGPAGEPSAGGPS